MAEPIPVLMGGVLYPSLAAAGRALGYSRSAVWMALEQGREVGGRQGRPGSKCYVSGRVYPSATAAAEDLGISRQAVSKRRARMRSMA